MIPIINSKKIVIEPVMDVIANIKSGRSNFLLGEVGSGKSVVIDTLADNFNNEKNPFIKASIKEEEALVIPNKDLFSLYYTSLIVKKMLQYVYSCYQKEYLDYFYFLDLRITNILNECRTLEQLGDYYGDKSEILKPYLLTSPESLIIEFCNLAHRHLDLNWPTLLIDNFDLVSNYNGRYQRIIYNRIRKLLGVVMSVSDSEVLDSPERIDMLKSKNNVVRIDYNYNPTYLKDIINSTLISEGLIEAGKIRFKGIGAFVKDEELVLLSKKCHGNIDLLLTVFRELYITCAEIIKRGINYFNRKYLLEMLEVIFDYQLSITKDITALRISRRKLYIKK